MLQMLIAAYHAALLEVRDSDADAFNKNSMVVGANMVLSNFTRKRGCYTMHEMVIFKQVMDQHRLYVFGCCYGWSAIRISGAQMIKLEAELDVIDSNHDPVV